MTRLLLLFSITLMLQCTTTVAQKTPANYITKKTVTGKAKKYYQKGMEYNIKGENSKALKEFEKALKASPRLIDAQIQLAAVKYDMKDYAGAETAFEKVLEMDPNYRTKVMYVLGLTEMKLKKFEEATEHLEQYLNSKAKNEDLRKRAAENLAIAKFSGRAMNNPVPFKPESLGNKINTTDAEYLPSLTADGETLIYTKRIGNQEDFYVSKKMDGEWQAGIPMEDINTNLNEGAQSISADGKLLVFTVCDKKDGYGSCDLYYSEVIKDRWTPVTNMGNKINSRARETQPSLSADGKAIYFASNRKDGLGGMDIWYSTRGEDGEWTTPKNMGDKINTSKHDRSPFIHSDGQTFYFMSNGHPGFGGHDLFYTRLQADGVWGDPINLGYPINTKADESTLVISLDGSTAYFATARDKDLENADANEAYKKLDLDLFSFPLYPEARPQPVTYVKANVYDVVTKKKLQAKVEFIDLNTGKLHAFSNTGEDGSFLVCLPMGKDYGLNVSKEKYFFHSENFALADKANLNDPYLLEIGLQPIPVASDPAVEAPAVAIPKYKPVILRNVFFDTGSAELRSESFMELDRLKNLLAENTSLRIQINGHTDNVGSEEDNLLLSGNRAKAVYTYLVEKGIEASRLSYKGFGESQAIDSNDTLEGRQRNRRTEFVVVGE